MSAQTVNMDGKQFVILPRDEYDRLLLIAGVDSDVELPPLPEPDADGCYPAVATATASLARRLIKRRWAVGLTQKELARRAGIRHETLNRLERGKTVPTPTTVGKVVKALEREEREA